MTQRAWNNQVGLYYGDPTGVPNNLGGFNSLSALLGIAGNELAYRMPDSMPGKPLNTLPLACGMYSGYSGGINTYPYHLILSEYRQYTGTYRLELRTNAGALLYELPDYYAANWTDEVNAPGSLSFSYPADVALTENFYNPNEIWMYRGAELLPSRTFIIQSVRWTDAETREVSVSAEGIMSQWATEVIRSYDSGGVTTVWNILNDWVNTQQQIQPGIYLGIIDPSFRNFSLTAAATNKTLLQAFRDLADLLGGYFYVTHTRRLCWRTTVGNDEGHVIRYGRNAIDITREIDYRGINNRLVAVASVNGTDSTITVNDTDSQDDYGIRTGFYEAPDVMTAGDLTALAEAELLRRSVPQTTISVSAIDLSHVDIDFEWHALGMEPGSRINLVRREEDATGLHIECRVFRITRDLMNPEAVTLEVGDTSRESGTTVTFAPKKSFVDALANVMGYVQRNVQKRVS